MRTRRRRGAAAPPSLPANVAYDPSLQHPRCVFQLLKQQYSRYTPEMVERITGIPKDQFLKAADLFTSIRKDGDMKKAATIIYAVGWTQHTFGTQIIRTAAMLQLLLGNVGRAGGGVNALRGHSNIQGATDMAGVFDILPGYLKMPTPDDVDFATYLEADRRRRRRSRPSGTRINYWSNTPKFAVSFLKAMYGDAATQGERLGVPLPAEDRSQLLVDADLGRHVRGQRQGAVRLRHERRPDRPELEEEHRRAEEGRVAGRRRDLSRRDQRVLASRRASTADEMKKIQTTVYRLPCAGFAEKDGTFVNSARWLQWKNAALPPPGEARLDQDILAQIFLQGARPVSARKAASSPIRSSTCAGPTRSPINPSLAEVAREINGRRSPTSPIRGTGQSRSRPASSCPASPG